MNEEMVKFSDLISLSIERLFKTGGLALVFIFLGFVTMIFGHFYSSNLSIYIFSIGALLSISILLLFLYTQIRGRIETGKIIRENKELLDASQEIAIGLTNAISETQSLLFKHVEDVGSILEISVPFLSQLPLLSNMKLSETLNVNAIIVATSGKSKEIIDDVHQALVNGDVRELRKYSDELKESTEALRNSLRTENKIVKHIPDLKDMQNNLLKLQNDLKEMQENFITLTNSFSSLLVFAIDYQEKVDKNLNGVIEFLSTVKLFGIDQKLNEFGIIKLQNLSGQVGQQLIKTKGLLDKLPGALKVGDAETIKSTLKDLVELESIILIKNRTE